MGKKEYQSNRGTNKNVWLCLNVSSGHMVPGLHLCGLLKRKYQWDRNKMCAC